MTAKASTAGDALRVFDREASSVAAISKIFFKGAVNETVHGFDSVHVVADGNALELLLGEVKFYANVSSAMSAVAAELEEHLEADWLRGECMLISNRLDPAWPHSDRLRELISERRTLDRVCPSIRVPVLLTYDSACVKGHSVEDAPYPENFCAEVREIHDRFSKRELPTRVVIDLIHVPLLDKSASSASWIASCGSFSRYDVRGTQGGRRHRGVRQPAAFRSDAMSAAVRANRSYGRTCGQSVSARRAPGCARSTRAPRWRSR